MLDRLGDIVKGTLELNLKYSSTLLRLSTDFLRDFSAVITESGGEAAPKPDKPPASRPPLLVAGQLKETPSAAFTLSNTTGTEVNVTLLVQGELSEQNVKVSPSNINMATGETRVVRLIAAIDDSLEVNRDYRGAVVAPGLSTQSVDFVVRRLPGEAAPTAVTPAEAPANTPPKPSVSRRKKYAAPRA